MTLYSVETPVALSVALAAVRAGEVIVIPTETIFGLTCDANNETAVDRLFNIKGRPAVKQSAVFLASTSVIENYAFIEHEAARRIIRSFLPGALTLILRSKTKPWRGVVGADGTIGIRVSSDTFVTSLVTALNLPLIATSANISGKPDCTSVDDLRAQFADQSLPIFYREPVIRSQHSTVVDLTHATPHLLREGAISFADIIKHSQ